MHVVAEKIDAHAHTSVSGQQLQYALASAVAADHYTECAEGELEAGTTANSMEHS